MTKEELISLFEKYCRKLRITPPWDIRLEFVEDASWRKTGGMKYMHFNSACSYAGLANMLELWSFRRASLTAGRLMDL